MTSTNETIWIACPTCQKQFVFEPKSPSMPFCSARCQMIDLGRWMNEEIGLPHVPSEDEEGDEPAEEVPQTREWRFD
jgi:uncharacterized protein